MKRYLRLARMLAIQGAIVLLLLEVIGRAIDPIGISYYPEGARFFDWLKRDDNSYWLPPNSEGEFWGAVVKTNALGLRGPEIPPKPPSGERRVLVVGDSVPFGIGVPYEDSIPAQLELLLNSRSPQIRHRVVNMGVPSYNTEAQLDQLEKVGFALSPDLIVLLYSQNDIESRMWVYEKRANVVANLAQRSYALSLIFVGARALSGGSGGNALVDPRYEPNHGRWLEVRAALSRMSDRAKQEGIPFVVLAGAAPDSHFFQRLRELAAEKDIAVAPMDFASHPLLGSERSGEFINSPVDGHCNKPGCRLMAELVLRLLDEAGGMPDPPRQ